MQNTPKSYEKPTVEVRGSVRDLTLGSSRTGTRRGSRD